MVFVYEVKMVSKKALQATLVLAIFLLGVGLFTGFIQQSAIGGVDSFIYVWKMEFGDVDCGVAGCGVRTDKPSKFTEPLESRAFKLETKVGIGQDPRQNIQIRLSGKEMTIKSNELVPIVDGASFFYTPEKVETTVVELPDGSLKEFVKSFEIRYHFRIDQSKLRVELLQEQGDVFFKKPYTAKYAVVDGLNSPFQTGALTQINRVPKRVLSTPERQILISVPTDTLGLQRIQVAPYYFFKSGNNEFWVSGANEVKQDFRVIPMQVGEEGVPERLLIAEQQPRISEAGAKDNTVLYVAIGVFVAVLLFFLIRR